MDEGLVVGDLDDAHDEGMDAGGEADGEDGADQGGIDADAGEAELDDAAVAAEMPEGVGGGAGHGGVGGPGGTLEAHGGEAKPAVDEDGVEDDVGAGADEHGRHGVAGVALGAHEAAHAEGEVGEDVANEDDGEVGMGVGDGLRGAAEEGEGLVEQEIGHHGNREEEEELEGDELAENLLGLVLAALAQADGEDGGGAGADEDAEGGEYHHVGEGEREAGHGIGADGATDVEAVDDVVDGLDGRGHDGGEGQAPEHFADGLGAEGVSGIGGGRAGGGGTRGRHRGGMVEMGGHVLAGPGPRYLNWIS